MKGSIHFRKDAGWWFVLWYDRSGGKGVKVTKYKGERMYDRRLAQKLLSLMQGDFEAGTFRLEKYTGEGWTDVVPYLTDWLKAVAPTLSPATKKDYECSIRNHLEPFFRENQFQLHEIQHDVLIKLLNSIDRDGKGKLNVMYCLHACLDYAWRSRRIQYMPPFPKRKLYNIEKKPILWVNEDRQMNIINAIPIEHRPIFLWLKYTTRRPGEACAILKADYDQINKVFAVHRSISAREVMDRTKTGKVHMVPCHCDFEPLVKDCLTTEGPYFFVNPRARKKDKRYTIESLNILWRDACAIAKEDIPLYSGLKKSTISQFLNEKGMSMSEVQAVTDHDKVESLKPYGQVELARRKELMERPKLICIPNVCRDSTGTENK